jgi:DNA-binding MarR family transcriptional regulator
MNEQLNLTTTLPARQPSSRSQVASILRLLQRFREIDPDIPVQICTTLMCIAECPGITQAEIVKGANMGTAAVNRHVRILGRYNAKRKEGFEYISAEVDEDDARRKNLYLTAKGYALLSALLEASA